MATSGTITYSLTARDVVKHALQLIRITSVGETPSAEDAAHALTAFNLLLKTEQLHSPSLWRQTFGSVTLVASTASYALSPRPFRVHEARYRDTAGRDIPMMELTREEYVEMPLKTSTGIPTSYYVDYQRTAATLYVWPVPAAATTETVQYTFQRVFEDLSSLNDDIDIPQEHLETVAYMLADRLQDTYNKDMPKLTERAMYLKSLASASDREAVVRIVPERR